MDVAVLLYEGFDELDAVGPFEVFRTAEREGADFYTRLVSLGGAGPVTAGQGTRVGAEDATAIPGRWTSWSSPAAGGATGAASARAEYDRGAIPEAVAAHHDAGATVAAVCTGGMLLAAAGVLDGRPAVTHASALADLRETGAEVHEGERPVDDGDVLTAGGVTSGLDLALHLVAREAGEGVAERVATVVEYERRHEAYAAGA